MTITGNVHLPTQFQRTHVGNVPRSRPSSKKGAHARGQPKQEGSSMITPLDAHSSDATFAARRTYRNATGRRSF